MIFVLASTRDLVFLAIGFFTDLVLPVVFLGLAAVFDLALTPAFDLDFLLETFFDFTTMNHILSLFIETPSASFNTNRKLTGKLPYPASKEIPQLIWTACRESPAETFRGHHRTEYAA